MTHEQRAGLVRTLITWTLLILAAVAGFWYFPGRNKPLADTRPAIAGVDPETLKKAKDVANCLVVIQHHLAGNVDSEKLADAMAHLDSQYGEDVRFHLLDAKKYPELSKQEGAKQLPHLDIFYEKKKVFSREGPMTEAELKQAIDELLRGLVRRTTKGWLPTVNGMQPNRGGNVIPISPAEGK